MFSTAQFELVLSISHKRRADGAAEGLLIWRFFNRAASPAVVSPWCGWHWYSPSASGLVKERNKDEREQGVLVAPLAKVHDGIMLGSNPALYFCHIAFPFLSPSALFVFTVKDPTERESHRNNEWIKRMKTNMSVNIYNSTKHREAISHCQAVFFFFFENSPVRKTKYGWLWDPFSSPGRLFVEALLPKVIGFGCRALINMAQYWVVP